jgi:hypothetical protein
MSNATLDASRFAPRSGSIRCTVRSRAPLVSAASGLDVLPQYAQYTVASWDAPGDTGLSVPIPFVWLPATLPMIEDAIVEVAGDGLRSAWAPAVYPNELAQLLGDVELPTTTDNYSSLVRTLWRNDPFNTRIIASVARTEKTRLSSFHATIAHILGGDVNITLVADGFSTNSGQGTFLPGVRITIGLFECRVRWVDPSGQLLRFTAPPIEWICPGYRPCQVVLSISHPLPSVFSIRSLAAAADADLVRGLEEIPFGLQAGISIPPFLPGAGSTPVAGLAEGVSVVPMDPSAGYGTFVKLTATSHVSGIAAGFTYSRDCPPTDFDLNSTRCSDLSLGFAEQRPRCPLHPDNTSYMYSMPVWRHVSYTCICLSSAWLLELVSVKPACDGLQSSKQQVLRV